MPYMPKSHEKYDLLPCCRKDGGEVFDYPSKMITEAEKLLETSGLFPYNFDSYADYYGFLDNLISEHANQPEIAAKLEEVRRTVQAMNQKEEWSVLRYIGPSDSEGLGLTHGKNYYWPARSENPVYAGVIDDEELTAYLYPTDAVLWEILEDPTGMAYRTIYEGGPGAISQEQYDKLMEQLGK